MKHSYLWAIVAVVVVGGAAGLTLRSYTAVGPSQLKGELASELDPSDPRYKDVMCGPVSLSVALARLGVNSSSMNVASRCKVTSQGVALTDMERVANSIRRIEARARRLSWDEVRRLNGVAVLFVKGNHYLTVDPREAPQDTIGTARVRVYEPQTPAQWWTRAELEKVWTGEALVITKRAARVDEPRDGACIDWNECFVDQGFLRDAPIAHYRFAFRNDGSSDLRIDKVQKTCGCIEHRLSQERLAPGESAVIEVDVDLVRYEGYVHRSVVVQTNDATNPVSVLRMACGVPRSRIISSDMIHLEDLPLGGKVSQEFYVADPGFNGVRIQEARFAAHSSPNMGEHLSCLISWDFVEKETPPEFRTRSGDYVVRLLFEASNTCPLGPFQGEVSVVLEADDVVTTHKVVVKGMIVQDVHAVPRVALITLDPKGAGSATIDLHSHSKRGFSVVKMWSDGGNSLEIRPEGDSRAAISTYTITIHNSDVTAGAVPLKRVAFLELNDGSVVSVPVTIFRPPQ